MRSFLELNISKESSVLTQSEFKHKQSTYDDLIFLPDCKHWKDFHHSSSRLSEQQRPARRQRTSPHWGLNIWIVAFECREGCKWALQVFLINPRGYRDVDAEGKNIHVNLLKIQIMYHLKRNIYEFGNPLPSIAMTTYIITYLSYTKNDIAESLIWWYVCNV